jgi:hypothetical protein
VQVPSVAAEAQRHRHRDLEPLKQERASTTIRLTGLLSSQGVRLTSLSQVPAQLDPLRLWDGAALPRGLRRRRLRVDAHHPLLRQQMAAVEAERRAVRHSSQAASIETVRQLMPLNGMGINGAWLLVMECFAWRALKNRRAVGG